MELPLFNVRGLVIFPGAVVPLYVGRPDSIAVLEAVGKSRSRKLIVTTQHQAEVNDVPGLDEMFRTGVECKLVKSVKLGESIKCIVEALHRVQIQELRSHEGLRMVTFNPVEPVKPEGETMNLDEAKSEISNHISQIKGGQTLDLVGKINKVGTCRQLLDLVKGVLCSPLDVSIDEEQYKQNGFEYAFARNTDAKVNHSVLVRQSLLEAGTLGDEYNILMKILRTELPQH